MNKQAAEEMKEDFERMLVRIGEQLFAGLPESAITRYREEIRSEFRKGNNRNLLSQLNHICKKTSDDRTPALRRHLNRFPTEFQRMVRDWIKECSNSLGGRTADFTDSERRQIYQQVKTLRETLGMKRPKAVEQVARNWGVDPIKIEGILRHQHRYKDV